jgi:hypothetical protein
MSAAIFTICSRNYLGQAVSLMQSVVEHEPECDRYVVLVDRKVADAQIDPGVATVLWFEDLQIPDAEYRALVFDVLELNTNIKPTVLRRLLDRYDRCVYLDPDTYLYAPLEPVWEGLRSSNFVATPHLILPPVSAGAPWDQDLLRHGSFNLGFFAASASSETTRFLSWWEDRCLTSGFNAPSDGFFVDQKFVDHAHTYFDGLKVLRHPGLNIAYWNLDERPVTQRDGRWVVGDHPLVFMHFSGFIFDPKPHEALRITKNRTSITLETRPELAPLFSAYRERLVRNHHATLSRTPYSYDRFDDGASIGRLARRLVGSGAIPVSDRSAPFSSSGPIYRSLKNAGAISGAVSAGSASVRNRDAERQSLSRGMRLLGWLYRRLGATRYEALLKFMSHAGSTLNQMLVVRR